ncbi:MAG TPA: alpha/beta family hydrolase [Solirubrobacteraceae bacterium]|jgi:pimeloyl-ACP methyl ester carboxylesterase|nr:alpha/beta family hydrolase [Solirubrobacteraceae bacterium]
MSSITLTLDQVELKAELTVPGRPSGIVVFAHGSGSNRRSPRNRRVSEHMRAGGLGTLLLDLLTADEERRDRDSEEPRVEITLLARRLVAAIDWVDDAYRGTAPIGCFGASTGAAVALIAAAARRDTVRAVVSRGGRPDLARLVLPEVTAPTLLIVGSADTQVLSLNREAQRHMTAVTRLEVVEGAAHLFEEPGALEQVAQLASDWFLRQFAGEGDAPET